MMRIIILSMAIAAGACSSLVPGTLSAVSRLDPLTSDPAAVAVRLELPEGLAIRQGSARLELSARRAEERAGGVFALARQGDVWSIAPAERAGFRAAQAHIADWKAADPDGTNGTLSVTVDPCLTGDPLAASATGSVFIRTEAGGDFLPLLRDAPVRALMGEGQVSDTAPCG